MTAYESRMRRLRWGRCRSGRRWFWAAQDATGLQVHEQVHGWADSEAAAAEAAHSALVDLAGGRSANVYTGHGWARDELKTLNAARRRARPASTATDTGPVEYLYGTHTYEDLDGSFRTEIRTFRITKKTPKRIYYIRDDSPTSWSMLFTTGEPEIGFVNRQELETTGEVYNSSRWWSADFHLYTEPPDLTRTPEREHDLSRLKAEMAAVHPDRGGSDAEFIAAHRRYQQAKQWRSTA